MKIGAVWGSIFAVLFVVVTWLTLTPNPDDAEPSLAIARFISRMLFGDDAMGDKVAHFIAYGALSASAAFSHLRIAGRRVLVIAGLALYGALLEGLQGIGGVRVAELADALANFSGALAGYPAALVVERLALRVART